MEPQHSSRLAKVGGIKRVRQRVRGISGAPSLATINKAILLVSTDTGLGEQLQVRASRTGRTVVRAEGVAEASRLARALLPVAVLLDLDLPGEAAWETADLLLQQESCPPMILLTAQSEQFDIRTATRAGSLVDKSAGPARLLEAVDQALATPGSAQAERNAIQRVVIRWLRPCSWSVPVSPAYRFWGINE